MRKLFMHKYLLLLFVFGIGFTEGFCQISLTSSNGTYSENFDVMGNAGTSYPAGWTGIRYAGSGTANATLTPAVSNGSSNTGTVYNVGTAGSSERALGTLASATTIPAFGASFINNTASIINSFSLSAVSEQWRTGSNAVVENVIFEYSTDATSLSNGTWTAISSLNLVELQTSSTTAAAIDGNLSSNRVAISGSVSSINLAISGTIWIRWRDADATGSDGMYALDDFTLTYVNATSGSSASDYYRTRQTGNWNDVNTWESSPVSDFSSGVVSPATLAPDFNANTITILNTHTVTVTANLSIDQTVVNSGGTITINNGNTLSVVDGAGFDLTVDGTVALQSSAGMIVKSTSAGTASIGISAGTISGNVTVERFISSSGNRAYRLFASSVTTTSTIHSNWQENATSRTDNPVPNYGTHITGTLVDQTNGFDATQTGQGSLFNFNNTTQQWIPATNTNAATLDAKTGYLLYLRGDRSINLDATTSPLPSTNTTLRATGTLLMGLQQFPGLVGSGDFSLITNPYASAVSWQTIYGRNSTIESFENYYTYWDPNIGTRGGYVTVTNGGVVSPDPAITPIPTPAGNINIQSGQAFFVKTYSGRSGLTTLTIDENAKTSTNNIDVFRTTSAAEKFTTSLFFNDAILGRRLADGVTALYDASYNKALDGNDAEEINNWDENIAIARGGKHLSIEERPLIATTDTLFLFMNNMKQQAYEFEFNPANFNHPGMVGQLIDKFTGARIPISLTASTVVPFTITSNATSQSSDRFYILFISAVALPITLSDINAILKNAGVQVEWTTHQESNMERYEVERSQSGQQFTSIGNVLAKGTSTIATNYNFFDASPYDGINYYRIKIIEKQGQISYSKIVKAKIIKGNSLITIYPNPIRGNSIILRLNNLQKGSYTISLTNKLGEQIVTKVIEHNGGTAIETIALSQKLATGTYQLKFTGNNINTISQIIKN